MSPAYLDDASGGSSSIQQFLEQLPHRTPAQLLEAVRGQGYIGQTAAVKAMSLMAYRHVQRLRYIFQQGVAEQDLSPKENYLLMGPTGCGKTFLVELLFNRILKLPATIIDITSYTESGYIGQDVVCMLTRLVHAADMDYERAAIGLICIDEFDKLSTSKNSALFAGQGTTKDVSGHGVQKELLKMLEGAEIDVPIELTHASYAPRATIRTHNIAFIACGAFSGFKKLIKRSNANIGFSAKAATDQGRNIAYQLDTNDLRRTHHFEDYGLMPELVGRFSRLIPFDPLSKDDLRDILYKNVMAKYERELELEGATLALDEAVLDKVVEEAFDRETGARGIRTALLSYIEEACYELYSSGKKGQKLVLKLKEDKIVWKIEG
jgi:ATP-dependent Clp protease ATP-binding subunit ClpX